MDPTFKIVDASKSLEKLFGFTSGEMRGKNLKTIFPHLPEIKKIKAELIKKRTTVNRNTTVFTKGKKEIPVSISATCREDEAGTIIGYFFAFVDIAKKKKMEENLKERIESMKRFIRLTVGRELKMLELKKEIKNLQELSKECKPPAKDSKDIAQK